MKLMTINQTLEKFPAFTQGGLNLLQENKRYWYSHN
jgi:hypothetical protein